MNLFAVLFVFVFTLSTTKGEEKRLLINDPGFDGNQLEMLRREVEHLKMENVRLETQARGGVAFVRWGRNSCDNDTEMVYSGYIGGSLYTERGGGIDYMCLPPDPQWGPKSNYTFAYTGHMYGSEYEDPILYGFSNTYVNAPCSLCFSPSYTNQMMVPGRHDCLSGWTKAYNGYLSAGLAGHSAHSQFICVDEHPDATEGGNTVNEDGKLIYGVRTVCGSLPCPPYHNNLVMTCAVCLR